MKYKTAAQKEEFIKKLFSNKLMFERHVLNVHSDDDRHDIMHILAKKLIREDLKEELNFLYLKNLDNSNFSLIINLIFKEFANEWISFAEEYLLYLREDALDEIQEKERVLFILSIVKYYFTHYKIEFFKEIADTFLELINTTSMHDISKYTIIQDVVSSNLMQKNGVFILYSYQQLYSRVKDARNIKNLEISKIQVRVHELSFEADNNKLEKFKTLLKKIENKSIAYFDQVLLRIRDTMANSMLQLDSLTSI